MKTVVFSGDIDFTINSEIKVIGKPLNGVEEYHSDAIFKKEMKADWISFFIPSGYNNQYGDYVGHYTRVSVHVSQLKQVMAMVESIEKREIPDGTKEMSDDLPF